MAKYTVFKTHWEKKTPYGNWRETPDRENVRTNSVTHIIREAKALGVAGRHAGSKPIKKLLLGIAKAHKALTKTKKGELKS